MPANYTDAQKQETKDAALSVGMKVIALPHEPTAAAIGNGLHKKNNSTVAVFDLGGGTLDVSIVRTEGNVFNIINTGSSPEIGGRDFNDKICNELLKKFEAANGFRPSKEKHAVFFQEMDQHIEHVKISLSIQTKAQVVLFCEGKQFQMTVTRDMFNSWVRGLAEKTIEKTRQVIADANLEISQIDEVYAVGGGSMMPIVVEMLEEFFGKKISKKCEPHCAAAFGGILCGRLEYQQRGEKYMVGSNILPPPSHILREILSHTIGIMALDGNRAEVCSEILGKKTPIPSMQTRQFQMSEPNQTEVLIQILEGENGQPFEKCLKLGHFELNDLPARPDVIGRIEVTFSLDRSGILTAKARDTVCGKEEQMQIDYDIKSKKTDAA